jgi:excisionase family DNA binding protein
VEQLLLRAEEAAKLLGLGRSKVFQLLASGELPSVRIVRAVRVPAAELRVWVERRTKESIGAGEGTA